MASIPVPTGERVGGRTLDKNYDFPSYRGPFMACRHLRPDGYAEPRCAAFPSGIPKAIWLERHDHTTPYPGDRDIRFESRRSGLS